MQGKGKARARQGQGKGSGQHLGDSDIHGKAASGKKAEGQRTGTGGRATERPGKLAPSQRSPSAGKGARRPPAAAPRRAAAPAAVLGADGLVVVRPGWREAIERTVQGLHYELVDVERAARGLLRVYIDRLPGLVYPGAESEFVTVEDCEQVTRQLQYSLEVDAVDYARLEVSSPGLDRPLRRAADYLRFEGQAVSVTLKEAFEGRKVFKGLLAQAQDASPEGGWTLTFAAGKLEQVLGFKLEEVREARLVPVLDFKGRRGSKAAGATATGFESLAGATPQVQTSGVDGG